MASKPYIAILLGIAACAATLISCAPRSDAPDTDGAAPLMRPLLREIRADSLMQCLTLPADPSCAADTGALGPYILWLDRAILSPDYTARALNRFTSGHRIITPPCGIYSWPIIAPLAAWALPARDIALAAPTDSRLPAALIPPARDLLARSAMQFDLALGLYRGASPSFITACAPHEMDAADLAATYSLRENIAHLALLRYLADTDPAYRPAADSLALAIETRFRLPERGCYTSILYTAPAPIPFSGVDNLAQTLAIAIGAIPEAAAAMLIERSPIIDTRLDTRPAIATFVPAARTVDPAETHITTALAAIAAARVNSPDILRIALARLLDAPPSPEALAALRGAILRALIGIAITPEGLRFTPCVPDEIRGDLTLHALSYRDATLDITIHGHGNVISTFALDGKALDTPIINPDIKGPHRLHITLVGTTPAHQPATLVTTEPIPATPTIAVDRHRKLQITPATGDYTYIIYTDGAILAHTTDTHIDLAPDNPENLPQTIAVVPIGTDNAAGYSPRAAFYASPRDITTIPADRIARTGTRVFKDKRLDRKYSRRFVESTRYKNADLHFDYYSPRGGRHYITLTYVDGLGIVNPDRHYALRRLSVNDTPGPLIILPQLPPESWAHNIKWWERTAQTIPVPVDLRPGPNTITLQYFAPDDTRLTDDANILLPVALHIIRQ